MDVLNAIYTTLRVGVTAAEFEKVRTREEQRRISDAYLARCKKISGDAVAYDMEKGKGLKRIDFLMERNTFAGLAGSGDDLDRWELVVS